eukprot:5044737-Amphidinium_carterae.1
MPIQTSLAQKQNESEPCLFLHENSLSATPDPIACNPSCFDRKAASRQNLLALNDSAKAWVLLHSEQGLAQVLVVQTRTQSQKRRIVLQSAMPHYQQGHIG